MRREGETEQEQEMREEARGKRVKKCQMIRTAFSMPARTGCHTYRQTGEIVKQQTQQQVPFSGQNCIKRILGGSY